MNGLPPKEPFLQPDDVRASTRLPVIVSLDHKPPSDQSELPKIVPVRIKN
jgi:hypothetical protein